MILCRCQCGEFYPLEDAYAGLVVECQKCGQELIVPAQSDPELLMVRPAGDEGSGAPMTKADAASQFAAGTLAKDEQVWTGTDWVTAEALFAAPIPIRRVVPVLKPMPSAPAPAAEAPPPAAAASADEPASEEPPAASTMPTAAPAEELPKLALRPIKKAGAAPVPAVVPKRAPVPTPVPAPEPPAASSSAPAGEMVIPDQGSTGSSGGLRLRKEGRSGTGMPAAQGPEGGRPDGTPAAEGGNGPQPPPFEPGSTRGHGLRGKKEEKPDKKRMGLVGILVRLVVVGVILFFGYKFGFGPILAHYLKKTSNVYVKNGDSIDYEASLGWRRISQELANNQIVRFQMYVGMPENQTLTLTPAEGQTGETVNVKVPLRWGNNVLINHKGKLPKFNEQAVAAEKVEAEMAEVVKQLTARKAPTTLPKVLDRVQGFQQNAFKGFFTDQMAMLGTCEISDFYTEKGMPLTTEDARVCGLPSRRFNFSDGFLTLIFDRPEQVDAQVKIPSEFSVELLSNVRVKVPAGTMAEVVRAGRHMRIHFSLGNQKLKLPKGDFLGAWEFHANTKPGDKSAKSSDWQYYWTFRGEGKINDEKVRVACTFHERQPITDKDIQIDKITK